MPILTKCKVTELKAEEDALGEPQLAVLIVVVEGGANGREFQGRRNGEHGILQASITSYLGFMCKNVG